MTIGGEVPTQAFAITRLLLALPIMMLNNTSQMSPAASCDQMTAEAAAGHVGLQHTCLRVVQRHQRPMRFIRPRCTGSSRSARRVPQRVAARPPSRQTA